MSEHITIEEMYDSMDYLGYDWHFNQIDCDTANKILCDVCFKNLGYSGFKKDDSYKAFIVCDNCQTAIEF